MLPTISLLVLLITIRLTFTPTQANKPDDAWQIPETITMGSDNGCAIQTNGSVECWGEI